MFARLPLTALRTFECAARLRSFRRAADELSVTPTAVSHQIRSLEHWLGAALFERLPRGVALTTAGERLFDSVHGALLDIQHAADALRPRPDTGQVLLSTNASFDSVFPQKETTTARSELVQRLRDRMTPTARNTD